MRYLTILTLSFIAVVSPAMGQNISPTEELRTTVNEWVETMRKIQQEENDWARDQEVLENYKEGLESEIATLKEQLSDAKTRKQGADGETLEKEQQRDRLVAAKDALTMYVHHLEMEMVKKLPDFPDPLLSDPKVAQWVEELKVAAALPESERGDGVSKRLMNVINLVSEAEKFQATVHVREELRKDADGKEFNMQMVYFGLACAYGVNAEGGFAVVSRPSGTGWKFEKHNELADDIQHLVDAIHGDQDAAFINLPLIKP